MIVISRSFHSRRTDAEKRRVAKRPQNGAIMRPIFSFKYGPMKKYNVSYQRWEESTIYRKTSPLSSITTVTSVQNRNTKSKFTTWNKSTKKPKIWTKPAKNERNWDNDFKLHSAAGVWEIYASIIKQHKLKPGTCGSPWCVQSNAFSFDETCSNDICLLWTCFAFNVNTAREIQTETKMINLHVKEAIFEKHVSKHTCVFSWFTVTVKTICNDPVA